MSGTIGGRTYGVAKAVQLRGVRVLNCSGSGSTSGIIIALDWVRTHAVKPAVANMSLGGGRSTALNTAFGDASSSAVASWINTNATAGAIRSNPSGTPNRLLFTAGL